MILLVEVSEGGSCLEGGYEGFIWEAGSGSMPFHR